MAPRNTASAPAVNIPGETPGARTWMNDSGDHNPTLAGDIDSKVRMPKLAKVRDTRVQFYRISRSKNEAEARRGHREDE